MRRVVAAEDGEPEGATEEKPGPEKHRKKHGKMHKALMVLGVLLVILLILMIAAPLFVKNIFCNIPIIGWIICY